MEALDELIAWATARHGDASLVEPRAEMQALIGEVFDDDRQVELRMAACLEWFVCDRIDTSSGRTPAQARYLEARLRDTPTHARRVLPYIDSVYAVFEVRARGQGRLTLKQLLSETCYTVHESRPLSGVTLGAICEARLIRIDGRCLLTPTVYWHPRQAWPLILKEAKRLHRADQNEQHAFVFQCAARALKAERYRQIAIEKVYDFVAPKL